MGPVEVTAVVAVVLAAVVLGIWVRGARRRGRRHRDEVEHGQDDTAMRAQVRERLRQVTAQWDRGADPGATDAVPASSADRTEPAGQHPPDPSPPPHRVGDPPRHRRTGRRIRVRRHRRA